MATTAVSTVEKARSLRAYMEKENIKLQFQLALPKWLTVDRFYRVVFSSMMTNPKLMECSIESILSSLMKCASLGLEPVLGRAHLIPYQNNKKAGRPLEMQMQPGYQGLMDLATRSGRIRDIQPYVVYEKDEFDLKYGDANTITHTPHRPLKDAGKPIGGYVVFEYSDGFRKKYWMDIDEIYDNHRSKSQAYNYAVKNGQKDTPWIEYESDMIKKTLIKSGSKYVPASIEFMEAAHIDDAMELGEPINFDLGGGDLGEDIIEMDTDVISAFVAMINEEDIELEVAEKFVKQSADEFEVSIDKVREAAIGRNSKEEKANFLNHLRAFVKEQNKPDPIRSQYKGLKSKGFKPWVKQLIPEDFDKLPEIYRREIRAKWADMHDKYPEDYPKQFPLDQKEEGEEKEPDKEPIIEEPAEKSMFDYQMEGKDEEKQERDLGRDDIQFQKELVAFMEVIGGKKFFKALEDMGYEKSHEIPTEKRQEVLNTLKNIVDAENE